MQVEEIAAKLTEAGKTVSVAEACTCGLVGYMLGTVPGSSRYFPGGVIAYTGGLKESVLSVPDEVAPNHGTVSREMAVGMARGVRELTGTDYAISTTGVTGPSRRALGTAHRYVLGRAVGQGWRGHGHRGPHRRRPRRHQARGRAGRSGSAGNRTLICKGCRQSISSFLRNQDFREGNTKDLQEGCRQFSISEHSCVRRNDGVNRATPILIQTTPPGQDRIWLRKAWVRSCCGLLKNCEGGASSMITPSSNIIIRSATSVAKPIS